MSLRAAAPLRSEPHNRPDAELDLMHELAIEHHETAAELDRAAGERADRGFEQDRQPLRFGTNREAGSQKLFQAGAEAEREAGEPFLRGAEVREAEAGGQKRAEPFHFLDDELAREVRMELVQGDLADGRPEKRKRSAEPQRRRRPRPAELDEGEVVETNAGSEPVTRRIVQFGFNRVGPVRLDGEG